MFIVSKRMEIAGAHKLALSYQSACTNLHGHNWVVTCTFADEQLNNEGMIIDFKHVKNAIHGVLDHRYINEVISDVNPTAENIAKWICNQFKNCVKVSVQESEGNIAIYIDPSWETRLGGLL